MSLEIWLISQKLIQVFVCIKLQLFNTYKTVAPRSSIQNVLDQGVQLLLVRYNTTYSVNNKNFYVGHGGDINICDEMKMTPLHRTATTSVDTHLFQLLCDNGANINAQDCRGNSPLLAMCDVAVTDDYDFFEDWSTTSDDTYEDTSATLCVQHPFMDYMLSQKNIQVL